MHSLLAIAERLELTLSQPYECSGFAQDFASALSIIKDHPQEVLRLSHARLHAFPFKDVSECWRRLYCEASLWLAHMHLRKAAAPGRIAEKDDDKTIAKVVRLLDMALIMTGAPGRLSLINSTLGDIAEIVRGSDEPASKRQRLSLDGITCGNLEKVPTSFAPMNNDICPPLLRPIKRAKDLSLPTFQDHLTTSHAHNGHSGPLPIIISGSMSSWPAMHPQAWSDPRYLLSKTINGLRVVPVELGKSYTDEAWGQKLQTMREFMENNMLVIQVPAQKRGYLAQHDLFAQIPSLRDDILIPDYCYSSPPRRATAAAVTVNQRSHDRSISETSRSESISSSDSDDDSDIHENIMLNAWLGPAHTTSPAHTDPHHNILTQVVGHKYVRLFAPSQTPKMYPRGSENGINMSNTSGVDVARGMQQYEDWHGWDEFDDVVDCESVHEASTKATLNNYFPDFASVEYVEGILAPGDCLYIPEGWWHYVRSLSPSFSVSFWWD